MTPSEVEQFKKMTGKEVYEKYAKLHKEGKIDLKQVGQIMDYWQSLQKPEDTIIKNFGGHVID